MEDAREKPPNLFISLTSDFFSFVLSDCMFDVPITLLEPVHGKMVDDTVENGGMVWHMEEGQRPIQMEIFVMKVNGLTMNRFVNEHVWHEGVT